MPETASGGRSLTALHFSGGKANKDPEKALRTSGSSKTGNSGLSLTGLLVVYLLSQKLFFRTTSFSSPPFLSTP